MASKNAFADALLTFDDTEGVQQAQIFRALGEPSRLALVARLALAPEPITVTEASSCCGVHLSGVSRHLALLRQAGVVRSVKRGREVLYELAIDDVTNALRGFADAIEACRLQCCKPKCRNEGDA